MTCNIDPTEQLAAWRLVERAWLDWFPTLPPNQVVGDVFVIDRSFPNSIVNEPDLALTRAQAHAALEYWHAKMIEAVEKVASEYRAEIETSARFSEAPKSRADEAGVL